MDNEGMDSDQYSFTVATRPVPKGRPRFNPSNGRAYTDQKTRAYEDVVAAAYNGPTYDVPVQVRIDLDVHGATVSVAPCEDSGSKLRGDIDNYAKAILDGMQAGEAFTNDKLVHSLIVTKL